MDEDDTTGGGGFASAGAFADFRANDDDDDDDGGGYDYGSDGDEMKAEPPRLASIFAPPTKLIHTGDFQAARRDAKAALKWLLVVITNEEVFASHEMNRDC